MSATFDITEVDLSRAKGHDCDGLDTKSTFLALIDGQLYFGRFWRQWYGLSFDGWGLGAGLQFDAPGENVSSWQKVWRVSPLFDAAALEHDYAVARRASAIRNGCQLYGVRVTEETPLAAFGYVPDYSDCPRADDYSEDDG